MGLLLPWPEPDSDPKNPQPILRSVDDGSFVHLYLACGHLITIPKDNVGKTLARAMTCWACGIQQNGNDESNPAK